MTATNEQAKEVLAQLMRRALDGVDAAVDFSQQQIPDVIEQLLVWKAAESAISMAVAVIMWVAAVTAWIKIVPFVEKVSTDGEDRAVCYGVATICSAFWLGLSIIPFDLTWLKIWVAPKLYLLEYGASLVK